MSQAPPQRFILSFILDFFLNIQASPITQYDRERLSHIRLLVGNTFSPPTMGNIHCWDYLLHLENGRDKGNEYRGPGSW